MAYVKLRENESMDSALKRFKKKIEQEGILKEYRQREFFIKPSTKKRLKKKEAIRKMKIKLKKKDRKR